MNNLREAVHRLTNQMQSVVGFLELEEYTKALACAKTAIVTLHFIGTVIRASEETDVT